MSDRFAEALAALRAAAKPGGAEGMWRFGIRPTTEVFLRLPRLAHHRSSPLG